MYEVYKLIVGVGLRRDIGLAYALNRFYFAIANLAGGDSYETARDLSVTLAGNFGWLDQYLQLQNVAKRIRCWQMARVFPQAGATFDGTIPLYSRHGVRVVQSGCRFVTTKVTWKTLGGETSRLRTEIPFPCSSDFPHQEIWTPYEIEVAQWAELHIAPIETLAGNGARACCRLKGGLFDELRGYTVENLPGRRLTRRGVQ